MKPEDIAEDLISLSKILQSRISSVNLREQTALISIMSPFNLAKYFKNYEEIQQAYLKHNEYNELNEIKTSSGLNDNMSLINFYFPIHYENEVIIEMMKEIDDAISSMGKDKEYLKVMYISCLVSGYRLDKESYIKYIEQGLEQFSTHIEILELANINKDAFHNNKRFYDRDSVQMNLLCLPTDNIKISKYFDKEFKIVSSFYEEIIKKIERSEEVRLSGKEYFKKFSDKNKSFELNRINSKLKNLTSDMFGFNKLEAKIIKSKILDIESKEKYIDKLNEVFERSFTQKVKEIAQFHINIPSDDTQIEKTANEIKLLVTLDDSEINVYVNDFIFNNSKNKNIASELIKNDDYFIEISRVNKKSAVISLRDLSEDKKYLAKDKEILQMFEKKFKELIMLFKHKNKDRATSIYVSYSSSIEKQKMNQQVGSFVELLHQEIRELKLMFILQNNDKRKDRKNNRKI